MDIKSFLNKELSFEEINDWLGELLGFSCNNPGEDTTKRFEVYDEKYDYVAFRKYIGMKPLNTLSGILLLKEKIDKEHGELIGTNKLKRSIEEALGIKSHL